MQTLQQHLDHAHEQLKIPPGALETTHHHAATASTLLSCLRFGGLDDDDIRDYLAVGDPQFVANWAVKLKRRGSPDARQAAHYLEALTHEQDAELSKRWRWRPWPSARRGRAAPVRSTVTSFS
jgi:hypothetical protein